MIDGALIKQYQRDGYAVVPGLFTPEEVALYREHYMRLRLDGSYEFDTVDTTGEDVMMHDPLLKYPRLTHPHRWDQLSLDWMLDRRIVAWLEALHGPDPYAVQTMVYFKPPGSRGQALHQDQFYLRVEPGTCIAAWMALDACDEENGCLQVVPGTQDLPILCTVDADPTLSFTGDTVELPEGMEPVPVIMQPGEVLFFNGQLIHGSFPNTSQDRFRRTLIGHYIYGKAEKVAAWFKPIWRMDGSTLEIDVSEWGGPCGMWVNTDGTPMPEMLGIETRQNYDD